MFTKKRQRVMSFADGQILSFLLIDIYEILCSKHQCFLFWKEKKTLKAYDSCFTVIKILKLIISNYEIIIIFILYTYQLYESDVQTV